MSNQRTHYVTTTDGVIIGGTVHGEGPPLVFLQGAVGDGDIDWDRLVEHLTGRFTCHLPSMRGRGLSGDHPDLSPGRRAEDIVTYIASIERPIGLVGWSGGANSALAVAAQSDAVDAVAAFEPGILSLMDGAQKAVVGAAVASTAERAAEGDLVLLLGSNTKSFFMASARHVADHVPEARVQEIPGAGHAAPLTHPEALADALTQFFTRAQEPA